MFSVGSVSHNSMSPLSSVDVPCHKVVVADDVIVRKHSGRYASWALSIWVCLMSALSACNIALTREQLKVLSIKEYIIPKAGVRAYETPGQR